MMKCTACHTELSGGLDTFGSHDMPFCWSCWSDLGGYDESNYDVMQRNRVPVNIPGQARMTGLGIDKSETHGIMKLSTTVGGVTPAEFDGTKLGT